MLSLWTRVAQIRGSCRCPQCNGIVKGAARTATTSAAKRPRYLLTSSTVFYSGLFTAAATWDAISKVQRRERWDVAIAEVKHELGDFEEVVNQQVAEQQETSKGRGRYGFTLNRLGTIGDGELGENAKYVPMFAAQEQAPGKEMLDTAALPGERVSPHPTNSLDGGGDSDAAVGKMSVGQNMPKRPKDTDKITYAPFAPPQGQRPQGHGNIGIFQGDEALRELANNLDSSSRRKSRPQIPTQTGPAPELEWLPPQSIYALDEVKRRYETVGWSPKKVERCMLSTDIFMLHTWMELRRTGSSDEAAQAVPSSFAKFVTMSESDMRRIITQKEADFEKVRSMSGERYEGGKYRRSKDDIPLCSYRADEHGEFADAAHSLNDSLKDLLKQAEDGLCSIPTLMAKITYSLSESISPPNLDTYNILLAGLVNLRQVKHTEQVIHSLIRTKARPNEVTLATVLTFHTATGDVDNFRWWVSRMRGKFGGLMKANPYAQISPNAPCHRLIRVPGVENDGRGTVIQLPYPTPIVFSAIVKGILTFSGLEAALKVCQGMRQQGWGLCLSGLGVMLRDCTRRKDWAAGLMVWKEIQALKWKSAQYRNTKWTSETIGLQTFITMLQLCARCRQREVFEDVIAQACKAHPGALDEILDIVQKDVPVVEDLVLSNDSKLKYLDSIWPSSETYRPRGDIFEWYVFQDVNSDLESMGDDYPTYMVETEDDRFNDDSVDEITIEQTHNVSSDELRECLQERSKLPASFDYIYREIPI